ncbi:MAG TPA: FlgD immunoglobulin-like domain containing protein [bacterium]|nr:FlgD immunoglobulin-like domain containing protein [bacterium]
MKPRAILLAALAVCWCAWVARPCLADYTIPASGATEGGGRGTAGQYDMIYTFGQPSPPGTFAVGNYSLSAGLVGMLFDHVPPMIVHQPAKAVAAGASAAIRAHITDLGTGVDSAALYYRDGGAATFTEARLAKGEDSTYAADLPASSVSERGLVYYLEASDNNGNISRYPEGAPDSVINLAIYFADLSSAVELPADKYRMVSVPGIPTNGSPDSVLADDFGKYNKKNWRLGRWNGTRAGCADACYDEYPSAGDFAPGRAFWLISSAARTFDASGVTTNPSRPFTVELAKGWNQIGTPFGFPTNWSSARVRFGQVTYPIGELNVVGSDTVLVENNLVAYDGAYQPLQSELLPWSGYWIYNASNTDVGLWLDPDPNHQVQVQPGLALGSAGVANFSVSISVKSSGSGAQPALAGMSPKASDGWDPLDLHEPPAIGDYLRAVFKHDDWGAKSGMYMADMRSTSSDGASWDFSVEASRRDHAALDLTTTGDIPATWDVFIYDLRTGVRLDRAGLPYNFEIEGSRAFTLVAGTPDFVASQESTANLGSKPGIISVVPNPFRESVSLTYFLPDRAPVALNVYSVEGRLVRTIPGESARGLHAITWDGRSLAGAEAAPGIYFLRLETAHSDLVRKVLRIR